MNPHDLLELGVRLTREGLAPAGAGSLSAADGRALLVTARGVPLHHLAPADLIPVGEGEQRWEPPRRAPAPLWHLHRALHAARRDVPLVAIVPAPRALALGLLGEHLPALVPAHYQSFGRLVPCVRSATLGTAGYVDELIRAATYAPALLLQNLGLLAMGATASALVRRLAAVEAAAALYLDALAAGTPQPLSSTTLQWLDEVGWD